MQDAKGPAVTVPTETQIAEIEKAAEEYGHASVDDIEILIAAYRELQQQVADQKLIIELAEKNLRVIEGADIDILHGRSVMDAEEEKALSLRLMRDALNRKVVSDVE